MRFKTKILLVPLLLMAALGLAQNPPHFQHIIIVFQENRTPDNLFGGNISLLPGADLQTGPKSPGSWCLGACFDPNHGHTPWETMWNYNNQGWQGGIGACYEGYADTCFIFTPFSTCNGQVVNPPLPDCVQQTYVDYNYDGGVVQPYFEIAQNYGFGNYMFATNEGGSFPAHQFILSGTSAPSGTINGLDYHFFASENPTHQTDTGCAGSGSDSVLVIDTTGNEHNYPPVKPCFDHNSLPTLLDNAVPNPISWKYYTSGEKGIWTAPNAIQELCLPLVPQGSKLECGNPDWINKVVLDPGQVLVDLGMGTIPQRCALPQVSWVIPNGDRSDHPGFQATENSSTDIEGGPAWVADIVNAVGTTTCTDNGTPYWQDTAIFIAWDDWGGWWDHINPATVPGIGVYNNCQSWGCGYTWGFRVPLLVVSAYTGIYKNGTYYPYISGDTRTQGMTFPYIHDFGSILGFIENNFGLGIGNINKVNNYPFDDYYAPDAQGGNIPLADFFNQIPINKPRPFVYINIPPAWQSYDYNYFINYFANGNPPLDPDNDAVDND
jgi:phospholipase C